MQQKTNKQRNITIINSRSGKVEPNDKCNILYITLPIMQDILSNKSSLNTCMQNCEIW